MVSKDRLYTSHGLERQTFESELMKIPSTPLTFLSFTKTAIHVPGFGHLWVGSCLTSFQSVGANCSRFERQMRSQADWPKLGECMSHTGKVLEVSRESGVGQNLECVQRALETLGPITCKYSFLLKDLLWWLNIRSPYMNWYALGSFICPVKQTWLNIPKWWVSGV